MLRLYTVIHCFVVSAIFIFIVIQYYAFDRVSAVEPAKLLDLNTAYYSYIYIHIYIISYSAYCCIILFSLWLRLSPCMWIRRRIKCLIHLTDVPFPGYSQCQLKNAIMNIGSTCPTPRWFRCNAGSFLSSFRHLYISSHYKLTHSFVPHTDTAKKNTMLWHVMHLYTLYYVCYHFVVM